MEEWFKVAADLPTDSKIVFIRNQSGGDSMCLLWLFLMCRATKLNAGGRVYVAPGVPYTEKQLAAEFSMKPAIVETALGLFERLGMIQTDADGILISKWAVHQNVAGMEQARAKNKERQAAFRERARQNAQAQTAQEPDGFMVRHGINYAYKTSPAAKAATAQIICDAITSAGILPQFSSMHEAVTEGLNTRTPGEIFDAAQHSKDWAVFTAQMMGG